MADIDIERKGPGIWPWIIGLVVLGLVAWLLFSLFGNDATIEEPVVAAVDPAPMAPVPSMAGADSASVPPAVQQYLASCAAREPSAMALDHQYTSNCIQALVNGVDAVLQRPDMAGIDARGQMQEARQSAQRLAQSAETASDHAGMTRGAFEAIAAVMNTIQDARHPGFEAQVAELEETANSIQTGTDLLNQREAVQRYFAQAGDVLTAMAGGPPGGA